MISFIFKGVAIGFAVAAPVGPIAILCIHRTLSQGRALGLAAGFGAATADAFYGILALFGVEALAVFLLDHEQALQIAGGILLLWLALSTFRRKISSPSLGRDFPVDQNLSQKQIAASFSSTFLLTLANPMTILAFAGIITALASDGGERNLYDAALLMLGVFLGSAAWWVFLVFSVGMLKKSFSAHMLRFLDIFSGLILLGFGLNAIRLGLTS